MRLEDLPRLSVLEPAFFEDPHAVLAPIRKQSPLAQSERGLELLCTPTASKRCATRLLRWDSTR